MAVLVLINGAPGSGKSTLAELLARDKSMALPIDLDALKHSLGHWDAQPSVAGEHARTLCLALVGAQLSAGHDVIIGQYLAKSAFIEQLEAAARTHRASFKEVVLDVDAETLGTRLAARATAPSRSEHAVNNLLVRPADAVRLVDSMTVLRDLRPAALRIDAHGTQDDTLHALRTAINL